MMIWSQSNFDEAEKLFNDKSMNRHYIRSTSKNESVKFKTIEYLGDIAGSNKKWDDAVFYYKS
jgi:predicted ribonuclease YlaK